MEVLLKKAMHIANLEKNTILGALVFQMSMILLKLYIYELAS